MGSREKMTGFIEKRTSLAAAHPNTGLCRDRISQLLDSESFVELDSLVESRGLNFGFSRPPVSGDGVVTGYGTIDGRLVYLAAQDPAVYGGSIGEMHAAKICKSIQLALTAQVPFIGLYDTGGARIEEGIIGLESLGSLLAALDSAAGEIPLIAAVFGPCAGGAAFAAAISDFVLMNEKGSGIFMNGPMVTTAVEGKSIEPGEIGGARIHAEQTGLASITAADESGMIAKIRELLTYLPDCAIGFTTSGLTPDDPNRTSERLDEIASGLDSGYEIREIIRETFDTSSFLEISAGFAPGMVTGLARLDGNVVGVLANNAARLDAEQARKAVRQINMCERFAIPLITLTDAEGYVIGVEAERNGLVQSGAELLQAVLRLSVPRISVIIGKAIGTAYLTLSSKSCGADLVYAWPTAEIAVVNPDTAAHIIYRKEIAAAANPAAARNDFVQRYIDEVASPDIAASLGSVDEVIRPSATRPRLVSALEMLTNAY